MPLCLVRSVMRQLWPWLWHFVLWVVLSPYKGWFVYTSKSFLCSDTVEVNFLCSTIKCWLYCTQITLRFITVKLKQTQYRVPVIFCTVCLNSTFLSEFYIFLQCVILLVVFVLIVRKTFLVFMSWWKLKKAWQSQWNIYSGALHEVVPVDKKKWIYSNAMY